MAFPCSPEFTVQICLMPGVKAITTYFGGKPVAILADGYGPPLIVDLRTSDATEIPALW